VKELQASAEGTQSPTENGTGGATVEEPGGTLRAERGGDCTEGSRGGEIAGQSQQKKEQEEAEVQRLARQQLEEQAQSGSRSGARRRTMRRWWTEERMYRLWINSLGCPSPVSHLFQDLRDGYGETRRASGCRGWQLCPAAGARVLLQCWCKGGPPTAVTFPCQCSATSFSCALWLAARAPPQVHSAGGPGQSEAGCVDWVAGAPPAVRRPLNLGQASAQKGWRGVQEAGELPAGHRGRAHPQPVPGGDWQRPHRGRPQEVPPW